MLLNYSTHEQINLFPEETDKDFQDFLGSLKDLPIEGFNSDILEDNHELLLIYDYIKSDIHNLYNEVHNLGLLLTLEDKQLIKKAYFISFLAHHNQKRDDGTPYLEHPIRIALISLLLPLNQGETYGIRFSIGLLHDVIEDSAIDINYLRKLFKLPFNDKIPSKHIEDGDNYIIPNSVDGLSKNEWKFYLQDIDQEQLNEEEKSYIETRQNKFDKGHREIAKSKLTTKQKHLARLEINRNLVSIAGLTQNIKNLAKDQRDIQYYSELMDLIVYKGVDRCESFATMHTWSDKKITRKIKQTIKNVLDRLKTSNIVLYLTLTKQINDMIINNGLDLEIIKLDPNINYSKAQLDHSDELLSYLYEVINKRFVTRNLYSDLDVGSTVIRGKISSIIGDNMYIYDPRIESTRETYLKQVENITCSSKNTL